MRQGTLSKDGTVSTSLVLSKESVHLNRYMRFLGGEPIPAIAEADGVNMKTALESVKAGRAIHEAGEVLKMRALKHETALSALQTRRTAQIELDPISGTKILLKGLPYIQELNPQTGVMELLPIDLKAVSDGVLHARKLMATDERPVQNEVNVNILNNNNVNETPVGDGQSFEERLARIRQEQLIDHGEVIDTEVLEVEQEIAEIVEEEPLF